MGRRQTRDHNSHTRLFHVGSIWDMNNMRKPVFFMGLKAAAILLLSEHFHTCSLQLSLK